jgi:hypothetical protein
MNLGDWEKELSSMSYTDLVLRLQALNTLKNWPAFYKAFRGFSTFVLVSMIQYEIKKRKNAG